jgi:hypothetical protein
VAASEAAVGPVRSSLSLGRSEEISSWGSVGPARVHEVKGLA